jgi:hypothetical protein
MTKCQGFGRKSKWACKPFNIQIGVFWDMTPRRSCKNWRFGSTYHLHLQGDKIQRARNNVSSNQQLVDSFHPDDGGETFLRNVGSYKSHAASHSKRDIFHSHHRGNLKSYIFNIQRYYLLNTHLKLYFFNLRGWSGTKSSSPTAFCWSIVPALYKHWRWMWSN